MPYIRMHSLLDALFSLFGKKAVGQVAGATIIGAMVGGLAVFRSEGHPPVGNLWSWIIGGAAAGMTAGLILLSPKVFFGSVFGLLGLATALIPMSHGDGKPASLTEHALKVGIGAAFMVLSIALISWRLRKCSSVDRPRPAEVREGF